MRLFLILSEVSMKCTHKGPILVQFLFAEFDRINGNIDFELGHGILSDSKIESIFVFGFRLPNDSIDKYNSWKVIVDDAAINNSFS